MHQPLLTIFTTNHIAIPTINHNADQSITTFDWISNRHLILKITQNDETSVPRNSPSQDSFHPDNQTPSKYGFKLFAIVGIALIHQSAYCFLFPETEVVFFNIFNQGSICKIVWMKALYFYFFFSVTFNWSWCSTFCFCCIIKRWCI